jgi:hypothetical protein
MVRIGLLAGVVAVLSCGGGPDDHGGRPDAADRPGDGGPLADGASGGDAQAAGQVPASPDTLFAYLQSRSYQRFSAESAPHPSAGPHGDVRAFLNPALESSLAAGDATHPVGAAAVKELYSGGAVSGWAVSVKVGAGTGGQSWYWYEVFSTSSGDDPIEGVGNSICTGCHAGGVDFVLVAYPLD